MIHHQPVVLNPTPLARGGGGLVDFFWIAFGFRRASQVRNRETS